MDLIGKGYWQAANGDQSLDLNGRAPGAISQSFGTTPLVTYEMQFSLAGNPEGGPSLKQVRVTVGGSSQNYTVSIAGRSRARMGYQIARISFTARSFSTRVAFESRTTGPWGPVLDQVRICKFGCPPPGSGLIHWLVPSAS